MVLICPRCGSTNVAHTSDFMSILSAPSSMRCSDCGFASLGMPDVKDPEAFRKKFL